MNGLPGLIGSSTHEAFSLRRWIAFFRDALNAADAPGVTMPNEVDSFIRHVSDALAHPDPNHFFPTWDRLAELREGFRSRTRMGIGGDEQMVSASDIRQFLDRAAAALECGSRLALQPNQLCTSYFIHDVTEYEELPLNAAKPGSTEKPVIHVRAKAFRQVPVSAFLEGSVQALRSATPEEAAAIYRTVRKSSLYDAKLGMYRLNVPLKKESFEIGRSKTFTPGWLENESIFLHMHYKFLLETLRSGLAKEFFTDIRRALVAFQDPEIYGRSPLENSSFICSSRFPDAKGHGTGFVALLTGATAEWISMVFHMALGAAPFRVVDGELRFEPKPVLADWLFASKAADGFAAHTFAVKLFGSTWVVYDNPRRKSTFGVGAVSPKSFTATYRDGRTVAQAGACLPAVLARDLRDGALDRLTIALG